MYTLKAIVSFALTRPSTGCKFNLSTFNRNVSTFSFELVGRSHALLKATATFSSKSCSLTTTFFSIPSLGTSISASAIESVICVGSAAVDVLATAAVVATFSTEIVWIDRTARMTRVVAGNGNSSTTFFSIVSSPSTSSSSSLCLNLCQ